MLIITIIGFGTDVSAGLGLSPPYFENVQLTRESVYEQRIMLTRGSPEQAMEAEVLVEVPGAEDWITIRARDWSEDPDAEDAKESWVEIESGDHIYLPAGEQRVPVVFRVDVPKRAPYDEYLGHIRFNVREVEQDDEELEGGGVAIRLGARANVKLDVSDRVIKEFEIRRVRLDEFNARRFVRWLEYPGRMPVKMTVKNTGNVPVAPSRVLVDIYDIQRQEFLQRTEHTNGIKKVEPFATEEVVAYLPVFLDEGSYQAAYRIFNDDKEVRSGEASFRIRPEGYLEDDPGYGFMGLSTWHKLTIVGPIALIIGFFLSLWLWLFPVHRRKLKAFPGVVVRSIKGKFLQLKKRVGR